MSTAYALLVVHARKEEEEEEGISQLFVGARQNLAVLGVWPIDTYSLNLVNFGLLFQRLNF